MELHFETSYTISYWYHIGKIYDIYIKQKRDMAQKLSDKNVSTNEFHNKN